MAEPLEEGHAQQMSSDAVDEKSISYEEAKALAGDVDPEVRRSLAARGDIEAEILYFLAEDESADVRRTVAENMAAPRQTYALLARDDDEDVRCGLVDKIARVAPDLDAEHRDKLYQSTHEALELLARDQLTRVRQVLSEALKDVPDAPSDIVRMLARDEEHAVSGPVLEFSQVLTDEDLIEIIHGGTSGENLNAISRRSGVSESVSDAVVGTDDSEAIATLLSNDSAQIREETLDDLIDRAPGEELWHAPLVSRPILPKTAPQRLARFIATDLLHKLEERADLDQETMRELKSVVEQRLAEDGGGENSGHVDFSQVALPVTMVRRLSQTSGLHDSVIKSALQAEDFPFVLAALVVRTGVQEKVVRYIFKERSAEGIVALANRAGLSPEFALLLQQRVARVTPGDLLKPREAPDGEKEFPLTADQMSWQIEFFEDMVTRSGV